jgi:hypothetical protein
MAVIPASRYPPGPDPDLFGNSFNRTTALVNPGPGVGSFTSQDDKHDNFSWVTQETVAYHFGAIIRGEHDGVLKNWEGKSHAIFVRSRSALENERVNVSEVRSLSAVNLLLRNDQRYQGDDVTADQILSEWKLYGICDVVNPFDATIRNRPWPQVTVNCRVGGWASHAFNYWLGQERSTDLVRGNSEGLYLWFVLKKMPFASLRYRSVKRDASGAPVRADDEGMRWQFHPLATRSAEPPDMSHYCEIGANGSGYTGAWIRVGRTSFIERKAETKPGLTYTFVHPECEEDVSENLKHMGKCDILLKIG